MSLIKESKTLLFQFLIGGWELPSLQGIECRMRITDKCWAMHMAGASEVTLVMGEVSQQRPQPQQCCSRLGRWRRPLACMKGCLLFCASLFVPCQSIGLILPVARTFRRNQRCGFLCEFSLFLNVCSCFQTLFMDSLHS